MKKNLANAFSNIIRFAVFKNNSNKKLFKSIRENMKSIKAKSFLEYLKEITILVSS
jgi:hypothetical protein